MRSIACNPQLVAVCNQHAVLDVIHRRVVCNQSEGKNIQSLCFDDIPFAMQTDYIRLTAITYNPSDWIKKEKLFQASLFLVRVLITDLF